MKIRCRGSANINGSQRRKGDREGARRAIAATPRGLTVNGNEKEGRKRKPKDFEKQNPACDSCIYHPLSPQPPAQTLSSFKNHHLLPPSPSPPFSPFCHPHARKRVLAPNIKINLLRQRRSQRTASQNTKRKRSSFGLGGSCPVKCRYPCKKIWP